MTKGEERKEEIKKEAEIRYPERINDWLSNFTPQSFFVSGAEWSDANPVNPWKSVKEELPKYQKRYFTRMEDEDGGEHYAYIPYLCDGKWWYPDYLSAYKKLKVTHWMPIPEPPKEKED